MNIYSPMLICDKCSCLTRHNYAGTEKRRYEAVEGRKKFSRAQREEMEKNAVMWAHIWKCIRCGTTRGYGNSYTDEPPAGDVEPRVDQK